MAHLALLNEQPASRSLNVGLYTFDGGITRGRSHIYGFTKYRARNFMVRLGDQYTVIYIRPYLDCSEMSALGRLPHVMGGRFPAGNTSTSITAACHYA